MTSAPPGGNRLHAIALAALDLAPDPSRYFSRCTLCNTLVEPVTEAAGHDAVPPGVRGRDLAFFRCPACAQIYWRGSHVEITCARTCWGAARPILEASSF